MITGVTFLYHLYPRYSRWNILCNVGEASSVIQGINRVLGIGCVIRRHLRFQFCQILLPVFRGWMGAKELRRASLGRGSRRTV